MADVTSTLSAIEAVWLLLAAAGVYYLVRLLIGAVGDLRWLERHRENGVRRRLAVAHVRHYWVYTAVMLGYLAIGVLAALAPPSPTQASSLRAVLFTAVLIGLEALMVLDAWLTRRMVQDITERDHGEEPKT